MAKWCDFLGYGNFAARTFSGRLFCLLFGIIGIPFMLCVLADVGGIMAGLLQVFSFIVHPIIILGIPFLLACLYSISLLMWHVVGILPQMPSFSPT